ncbi:Protein kinase, partial [Aphelenchoides avenae]
NIMRCKEVFACKELETDVVYIVMDLCRRPGTLHSLKKHSRLVENQMAYVMRECLKGIRELHYKNVIHCDLKSENVLVDELGNVKISDFGSSQTGTVAFAREGTVAFMPGEVQAIGGPSAKKRHAYTATVDEFSLGILSVDCLVGYLQDWLVQQGAKEDVNFIDRLFDWASSKLTRPIEAGMCQVLRACLAVSTCRAAADDLLQVELIKSASKASFMLAVEEYLR